MLAEYIYRAVRSRAIFDSLSISYSSFALEDIVPHVRIIIEVPVTLKIESTMNHWDGNKVTIVTCSRIGIMTFVVDTKNIEKKMVWNCSNVVLQFPHQLWIHYAQCDGIPIRPCEPVSKLRWKISSCQDQLVFPGINSLVQYHSYTTNIILLSNFIVMLQTHQMKRFILDMEVNKVRWYC